MLDLIIGRRELGKTTLAVCLCRYYSTRVIFDPRHMIETSSVILTDGEISEKLYSLLDENAEIVVRPVFDKEETFSEMCAEIFAWLRDNPTEPFCLLLDESRFIKTPELNPHFDYIVRCTPRVNIAVILTCHGVIDVSTDLRRIADYWVLFRLTMEADLERVREKCGDTVALEVSQLQPFEYIVWNDANSTWRKHSDKSRWYVPLEARLATV